MKLKTNFFILKFADFAEYRFFPIVLIYHSNSSWKFCNFINLIVFHTRSFSRNFSIRIIRKTHNNLSIRVSNCWRIDSTRWLVNNNKPFTICTHLCYSIWYHFYTLTGNIATFAALLNRITFEDIMCFLKNCYMTQIAVMTDITIRTVLVQTHYEYSHN